MAEPMHETLRRSLPPELERQAAAIVEDWDAHRKVTRLWERDATLWTGGEEGSWLGWLDAPARGLADAARLERFGEEVRAEGFTDALLLGMGGSSLCPEVLSLTFPPGPGMPRLTVLDSTDPVQVKAAEEAVDLARTLVFVSSKSGTTLEPTIFRDYFLDRMRLFLGDEAPRRFVAITDPGSKLEQEAHRDGFRHIFHGVPSIGGRYAALSDFGLAPGAAMGVDVRRLLHRAAAAAEACRAPGAGNPGLELGATIGACALAGRDKLTLVASPGIADLGAWLEQLVAESTGKQGKGVIPVDREPLGPPEAYGDDRLFAYLRLAAEADPAQDAAVDALERAGNPVVRLELADTYGIGAAFFVWEVATAVAGAALGIDPFDQPDVEAAKVAARKLTDAFEAAGALPPDEPLRIGDEGLDAEVNALLATLSPGDYLALLAYVPMTDAHEETLTEIRRSVRDATGVATCAGFGPRFLHSTGQAYKGGPPSGVFLQITCDHAEDVAIPGRRATFGVVEAAQARGDLEVLRERGRRCLRVHLGADAAAGLERLREAVERAL